MHDRVGRSAGWRALACGVVCAVTGCQQLGALGVSCSGAAADLDAEPRRLHVRVELIRDDVPQRHEVVVRVDPGRIVAVGLTPIGTQAYRISHDSSGVHVDNRVGRFLEYKPELVYDAIARAFLAVDPAQAEKGALITREARGARVESDRCGYVARLVVLTDGPVVPVRPSA